MPATIFFIVEDDRGGSDGRMEFPFPSSISMVSAGELADALVDILAPLMNGRIKSAGVSYELSLATNVANVTNALADIRDKARFSFIASGAAGLFPKRISIPTYDEAYTVPGTSQLDLTDPDVEAFVDAMIDGIVVTAGTIQPVDSRNYDLISLDYAIEE